MTALLAFKADGLVFEQYLKNLRKLLDGEELPVEAYGKIQQKMPKHYRTAYQFLLKGKLRKIGEVYVLRITPTLPRIYLIPATVFCVLFLLTGSIMLFILTFLFLLPEVFYQPTFYQILLSVMAKKRLGFLTHLSYKQALQEVLNEY
jgi:hypothetical protein